MGAVIDHFGINCSDFGKAKEFYDRVLGVLGFTRQMDFGIAIGYGKDGKPDFWIADADLGPNREIHVAFQAADEGAVRAFYDPRSNSAPNRCTRPGCGPSTTPDTSARSSATPTATTSRLCFTALIPRRPTAFGIRPEVPGSRGP